MQLVGLRGRDIDRVERRDATGIYKERQETWYEFNVIYMFVHQFH